MHVDFSARSALTSAGRRGAMPLLLRRSERSEELLPLVEESLPLVEDRGVASSEVAQCTKQCSARDTCIIFFYQKVPCVCKPWRTECRSFRSIPFFKFNNNRGSQVGFVVRDELTCFSEPSPLLLKAMLEDFRLAFHYKDRGGPSHASIQYRPYTRVLSSGPRVSRPRRAHTYPERLWPAVVNVIRIYTYI